MVRLNTATKTVVGFGLFMLGAWMGATSVDSSPNLRSVNGEEKQHGVVGDGSAVPAHIKAPEVFNRMASPSLSKDEGKDESEHYVWSGPFAFEAFQDLDSLIEYDLTASMSFSFSFAYDD